MSAKKIGILVFDKIEALDFVGPYEVFTAVRLDESKRWETQPPFDVYSAGIDLALKLVARYCGDDVALATARYMEYRYPNDNTRRV